MGRRPDLLHQTLESLAGLPPVPALAINDFGDEETNEVFRKFFPDGQIVGPGYNIGHHPAIDELYRHVKTPFIFHIEDDWQFNRVDFFLQASQLLQADPMISSVGLRDVNDFPASNIDADNPRIETLNGIEFERLDHLHDQWHGYTFNPHIARLSTWQELKGFSKFKKERHISRHLRAQGSYVAYLRPGPCRHIGDDRSTHLKAPSLFKRCKNWLRGR